MTGLTRVDARPDRSFNQGCRGGIRLYLCIWAEMKIDEGSQNQI